MKYLIFSLLAIFAFPKISSAQAVKPDDKQAVEKILQHYFAAGDTNDPNELGKAFYAGAMMFWAENENVNYLTQRQWKAALRANKTAVKASKRDIQITDCTADICVAKIVSSYADKVYYDYMALVKYGEGWRITAKVFFKTPPATAVAETPAADKKQIENLLEIKFKSMDANDPDLLASVYYPRTMSYYADENTLVGVSIGEWIARFASDRRKNSPIPKAVRKIVRVNTAGNVGYADFTHEFADVLVTDKVLLLKTENRWRIISLLFTAEDKKPT